VTHAEASALYPLREPFGAPGQPEVKDWGKPLRAAQRRAVSLGLAYTPQDGDTPVEADGPDGVILSGHADDGYAAPFHARWLGAVTLYYRPRAAASRSA
jgi:hypothetical protein